MAPSTPINQQQELQQQTLSPVNFEGRLIVAACESSGGIGRDGQLPWPRLGADMRHFRAVTADHPVIMGRETYLSLPSSARPLPGRLNVVLTHGEFSSVREQLDCNNNNNVLIVNSLNAARDLLMAKGKHMAYVIGGQQVFECALEERTWSQRVFLTVIKNEFECDRFFPINKFLDVNKNGIINKEGLFECIGIRNGLEDNDVKYSIHEYVRKDNCIEQQKQHEEYQYLNLVRRILSDGVLRGDRTGTGTLSVFGAQLRFNLRDKKFPLLTTKRVFWRGVAEELLWFIRGRTNANELSSKGIHIWDANGSREFLDGRGFKDREVGDLGPVYGFQWRHFGADYKSMHDDYTNKGVDQLQNIIDTLQNNPNDRRMIMSAWNPAVTNQMALPPCHLLAQFYVANTQLSCQMYQRSCDMGLGVPFNIASYALLTRLIAQVTGLEAGEFIHVLGDAHVYCNHVEALQCQIERIPKEFPTLEIKHKNKIEDFCFSDLTLNGYDPHGPLPMKMAV